jgi:hypothetical protein
VPPPLAAVTIDFDDFDHGDIVAAPLAKHPGYTLVVENDARSFDKAIAFDTEASGTADDDLERGSGFAEGNIQDAHLGRILGSRRTTAAARRSAARPTTRADRPAGKLTFVLDAQQELVLVRSRRRRRLDERGRPDHVLPARERRRRRTSSPSFTFADFLGLGQGVQYGDNSANHVELGRLRRVRRVRDPDGRLGGVDKPAPRRAARAGAGVGALLGIGLAALASGCAGG